MPTCPWCWARLTRLVPGFAHIVCAAAHPLGHVERQLVFTRGPIIASVAEAFPHICVGRNGSARHPEQRNQHACSANFTEGWNSGKGLSCSAVLTL